jgi:glycosyltransferase involved in cell wall biosynthesis
VKHLKTSTFITLATFNGGSFLAEQIESLLVQTEPSWSLLIRDDGSTDNTLDIIRGYAQTDQRIKLLANDGNSTGSALGNFSNLLAVAFESGAEHIFCCDQDDVWEPEKLAVMLTRLKQLEGEGKAASLVHHDLTVVNESLELLADSFIDLMQLHPTDQYNPQRLLSRNEVTGCAMACNRALLDIALPISSEAIMHDWWLALCAGYVGRLAFVPDKLVKYRQHRDNTIGAKSFWHGLNPFTNWVAGWRRGNEEFINTVRQARAFKEAMTDRLQKDPEAFTTLELYSEMVAATRWQRLKAWRQCGLWRSHWLLNVVLVMRMLLLPRNAEL